jgi:hypothetical protein
VSTTFIRRRIGVALASAALAGAAATAVASPAAAGTAPIRANDNLVRIVAHDSGSHMSFTVTGRPHAGLVAMRFVNRGHVAHEVDLAQMKKGVHLSDVRAALHSPKGEAAAAKLLVHPERSITGPDLLSAGKAETVYAPLHAGRYIVVCFLPGPDGMPHALMGMISAMHVLPASGRVTAPHTAGTVRINDHKIVLPKGFKNGGTFKVTNTGTRAHNLTLGRLRARTTLQTMFGCVGQAFAANKPIDGCPGWFVGGISDLAPGHSAYLRIAFPRGHYGYLSSDGNDFAKGLNGTFTVH